MGLLTTATADNRIVDRDLVITYSQKLVNGKWHWIYGLAEGDVWRAWEYRRFATKTYRYVGMDFDSAKTKAESILQSFTREYWISQFEYDSSGAHFYQYSGGIKPCATVSVNKMQGHMYEIIIQVNEEDVAYSTKIQNPETVFAYEQSRTYDF